ncbi:cytochrome-c peroxidase [Dyadobacter sp. CY312]|uniref:cytochrome-c peroxidase n=1 Tax=Dyadobacter sp. CY312 TaxID=2907303 RepID=UPI001F2B9F51|nr:cytochrome c peroxidase [Dyadobacter sp. CY312]MCE7038767.1 cytochrome-c peroxidase [Dyadobacter sp. CY312]
MQQLRAWIRKQLPTDGLGFFVSVLMLSICSFALFIAAVNRNVPEPYPFKFPANFGNRFIIPADNPTTKEGVHLGRMLFYETKLSANNKMSCGTCHEQKLAFSDGRPVSLGVDNSFTKRNSMALVNLLWVRNFFWDGRSPSLETQAVFPLTDPHEMGQSLEVSVLKLSKTKNYPRLFEKAFGIPKISPQLIQNALAQFERTLISADSNYDRYLAGTYTPTERELRGMNLFMNPPSPERSLRGANCGHCHGGPKTFKELFHNNGIDSTFSDPGRKNFTGDSADNGRFRVPTLRNIALTAPYMHDGRFRTLEQVLDHYSDHVQESETLSTFLKGVSNEKNGSHLSLTGEEKVSIISFLHMLTDTTFINNPEFSNPHLFSKK